MDDNEPIPTNSAGEADDCTDNMFDELLPRSSELDEFGIDTDEKGVPSDTPADSNESPGAGSASAECIILAVNVADPPCESANHDMADCGQTEQSCTLGSGSPSRSLCASHVQPEDFDLRQKLQALDSRSGQNPPLGNQVVHRKSAPRSLTADLVISYVSTPLNCDGTQLARNKPALVIPEKVGKPRSLLERLDEFDPPRSSGSSLFDSRNKRGSLALLSQYGDSFGSSTQESSHNSRRKRSLISGCRTTSYGCNPSSSRSSFGSSDRTKSLSRTSSRLKYSNSFRESGSSRNSRDSDRRSSRSSKDPSTSSGRSRGHGVTSRQRRTSEGSDYESDRRSERRCKQEKEQLSRRDRGDPHGHSHHDQGSRSTRSPRDVRRGESAVSSSPVLQDFLHKAQYFVMKSSNFDNIRIAKDNGVWSTPPYNQDKLNSAFLSSPNVILIFSVRESGHFQGFARLMSVLKPDSVPVPWVLPSGMDPKILAGAFDVAWLNKNEVPFSFCTHLLNPWNDNKGIKISRDGQEVEPSIGYQLCNLFPPDSSVDFWSISRKIPNFRPLAHRPPSPLQRVDRGHSVGTTVARSSRKHRRDSRRSSRSRSRSLSSEPESLDDDLDNDALLQGSYIDYVRKASAAPPGLGFVAPPSLFGFPAFAGMYRPFVPPFVPPPGFIPPCSLPLTSSPPRSRDGRSRRRS